jgi:AcrR family transcriptional regulator
MVNQRTGRRPGESGAREHILSAARATFAEKGFEGATIRTIAARARVDPALVLHYFRSKRALFVEAADLPVDAQAMATALLASGQAGAGERILRVFLSIWEVPRTRDAFVALIRAAMTDDEAAATLRDRLGAEILGRVAAMLATDHAEERAALVGSQLVGLAMGRYIIQLTALSTMSREEIIATIAPALERYLTGPFAISEEAVS